MIQNSAQPSPVPLHNILVAQRDEPTTEASCFQRFFDCLRACCCCASSQRRQVRPAVQPPPAQVVVQAARLPQPYMPPVEISKLDSAYASGSQHPGINSQHSRQIIRQASQSQPSNLASARPNLHVLSGN